MAKKYIKKINMPVSGTAEDLYIKDEEAVSTINGKSNTDINNGTVTFADTKITEAEINQALGISSGN